MRALPLDRGVWAALAAAALFGAGAPFAKLLLEGTGAEWDRNDYDYRKHVRKEKY